MGINLPLKMRCAEQLGLLGDKARQRSEVRVGMQNYEMNTNGHISQDVGGRREEMMLGINFCNC